MAKRKTWLDKYNDPRPPEIKPAPCDMAGMREGEIMLIPTPRLIDSFLRKIPRGECMDVKTLRQRLAEENRAEVTCPITTGFHLRTVAELAGQAAQAGARSKDVTPVWRVLDSSSATTKKLECGSAFIAEARRKEGLPE